MKKHLHKVHVFKEGQKNWRNLHGRFDIYIKLTVRILSNFVAFKINFNNKMLLQKNMNEFSGGLISMENSCFTQKRELHNFCFCFTAWQSSYKLFNECDMWDIHHSIPGFHSGNMRSLFALLCISSVTLGAPFDFVSFSNNKYVT